jgi:hypothetical protein
MHERSDAMAILELRRRRWRVNTRSAVEGRVRRSLAKQGEVLRVARPGSPEAREFGPYWTADALTGSPLRWGVDLEQVALEERVMYEGDVIEG